MHRPTGTISCWKIRYISLKKADLWIPRIVEFLLNVGFERCQDTAHVLRGARTRHMFWEVPGHATCFERCQDTPHVWEVPGHATCFERCQDTPHVLRGARTRHMFWEVPGHATCFERCQDTPHVLRGAWTRHMFWEVPGHGTCSAALVLQARRHF